MKRFGIPLLMLLAVASPAMAQRTEKPPLHAKKWMAITGKPLAATAGAMIFAKGGNAVDASAAMLAATCTMWDTLGWGGETQALIYNPHTGRVIGINALGVAPSGATPDFFREQGLTYPPEYGPLAATTPGTPGGLFVMLAEYGSMSLADVLAPAIEMADGYPIDQQTADRIEANRDRIAEWPYSRRVFLTHMENSGSGGGAVSTTTEGAAPAHDREVEVAASEGRWAPDGGEMFRQKDLASTLRKLVETERRALRAGRSRKEAIYAAYDRFYRGDIAKELVRSTQEQGGLITLDDLANWSVKTEDPVHVTYKGIDVYKLTVWTQGPALLQTLNILESFDLRAMGYNSARYTHTIYQAMSLAFSDRDFYYGDPYVGPEEPVRGLLSKEYAKQRAALINPERNDPTIGPGDPYPFQGGENPYLDLLDAWHDTAATKRIAWTDLDESFRTGTTSIEAADAEGWVVSITPSGAWVPAVIAGTTGVGLSQRMQSFVLDEKENPFNVVRPGQRPRVTLTPTLALKDGRPFLSFAVQGGDTQDQNLLQFFLNVVEFGMTVQQATEAANFNSYQMRSSFGDHLTQPGRLLLQSATPPWVREELEKMGYQLVFGDRTSGPINAILFDREHGTMWGGSSNHGEDYGIGW